MIADYISTGIAVLTAVGGFIALQSKASASAMERLDKAQIEALKNIQVYADRLEKQIVRLEQRELDLLSRIAVLEADTMECHRKSILLTQEVANLRTQLAEHTRQVKIS